ncbi:conserved hypothetical protein [Thermocrinis albus DSM 14484]|uniref:NnrS family protein n=1 Tax=Thermocrinis albus (strain DSM 14484 / JCM 11386 / HI 11/12) TaxID=638303 RepID=D3SMV7_THEAH|nr:hypothetical protein [Thermocrinis albus]ADC90087.1 conserved hypothetical protein [Thermocrinis albus DSM 14484]
MTGLQLLYLPPFSIVSRFFLTAALFGFLGTLLGLYEVVVDSFLLPAFVHIYTLGFMTMTMVGALFQMLPVVAGVVIERSLFVATYTHLTLVCGVLAFVGGFLLREKSILITGTALLLLALVPTASFMLFKLLRIKAHTPTSGGIRYALFSLLLGILLGSLEIFNLIGYSIFDYFWLLRAHLTVMLFGWVGILVASVAFRVIEMFFVTPPYPKIYAQLFPPAVLLSLLIASLRDVWILKLPVSILFLSFAFITFSRLRGRRRRIPDPLISLWYVSMLFLTLSSLLYPFAGGEGTLFYLFLFTFGSFAQSVIMAMMYRIIPFLVWIHLSNRGVPNAPTMHEVVSPKRVWAHLYLHLISIYLFLASFFTGVKALWVFCPLAYAISFGFLLLNLSSGVLLYIKKKGQQKS